MKKVLKEMTAAELRAEADNREKANATRLAQAENLGQLISRGEKKLTRLAAGDKRDHVEMKTERRKTKANGLNAAAAIGTAKVEQMRRRATKLEAAAA